MSFNLPNDQSLAGGLIQEFLPGNILNSNLLGYTTRFTTNTPVDQVAYSIARFQQDNQVGTVDYGVNQDNSKNQADIDFENRLKALMGIIGAGTLSTATGIGIGKTLPQTQSMTDEQSDFCKDYPDWMKPICNLGVSASKRIGLVIAGLVLLAIGIYALR